MLQNVNGIFFVVLWRLTKSQNQKISKISLFSLFYTFIFAINTMVYISSDPQQSITIKMISILCQSYISWSLSLFDSDGNIDCIQFILYSKSDSVRFIFRAFIINESVSFFLFSFLHRIIYIALKHIV